MFAFPSRWIPSIFKSGSPAAALRHRSWRLNLELLEDRTCPADGPGKLLPISIPNSDVFIQITMPTDFTNLLAGASDPNPGGILDYSTLTIVTNGQYGQAVADPTNGSIRYTPQDLLPPGLPPEQQPNVVVPDSFQFMIRDNLGAVSNVATANIVGSIGNPEAGDIVASNTYASTNSMQPVTVDVLKNVRIYDDSQIDPASVRQDPDFPRPAHGTVSFNRLTGEVTYTPDFGYVGFDSFNYLVSNNEGTSDEATLFIYIPPTSAPRLQSDPLGGTMLVVDGTSGADTILVSPASRCGEVQVTINGTVSGPFRPSGRIVVFGYGDNDNIQVSTGVTAPVLLVGGAGDDVLKAGSGPSILLGGNGNDELVSGSARDLLIGGLGADSLSGNGHDIIVAGTTAVDSNPAALAAILRGSKSHHSNHCHHHRPHDWQHRGRVCVWWSPNLDDGAVDTITTTGNRTTIFANRIGGPTGDIIVSLPDANHDRHSRHNRCGWRAACHRT